MKNVLQEKKQVKIIIETEEIIILILIKRQLNFFFFIFFPLNIYLNLNSKRQKKNLRKLYWEKINLVSGNFLV